MLKREPNISDAMPRVSAGDRRFASGAIWNLTGAFAYAFGVWLTSFIIAKHSGAGNYADAGVFAIAASFGNIFHILSAYGLRQYQVSDTSGEYGDADYIAARVLTVGMGYALCLLTSLLFGYSARQALAINIYMAFHSCGAFADVLFGVMQRNGRIDLTGKSLLLRGVLTTGAFAAALYLAGELLIALSAAAITALLIVALYDIPNARKWLVRRPSVSDLGGGKPWRLLAVGFPMLLYTVFVTLVTFAPRIILGQLAGEDAVGVFGYIFAPTVVISTFASGILLPFLSRMTDSWKHGDTRRLRKAFLLPFCIMLLVGVVGLAFAKLAGPWMLKLLYDAIVAREVALLMIAVGASTLISLAACCNNLCIVMRKMRALILLNALGLALTMLGCLLLIPRMGMYGAGWAIVCGVTAQLVVALPYLFIMMKQGDGEVCKRT